MAAEALERLSAAVVDRDSPVPAFLQIGEDLRRQILSGALPKGFRLPRETVLAERYGASRVTIRRALEELAQARLVERVHGVGTLVAAQATAISCDLSVMLSFADQLAKAGFAATVDVDRMSVVPMLEAAATALKAPPGADAVHLRRRIKVDDRPLVLNNSWLSCDRFPGLEKATLVKGSLWKTLKKAFKATPHHSDNKIDLISASTDESRLLEVEPETPLIRLSGVVYDVDNRPLEYCTAIWTNNVRLNFASEPYE